MARNLTLAQIELLQSPSVKARAYAIFYLDEGTSYFCDDFFDMYGPDGNLYVGAGILGASVQVQAAKPYASEPVTIICDGTRMSESGFTDPGSLFRTILQMPLQQRRVDIGVMFAYPTDLVFGLQIPLFTGKINNARVQDSQFDITSIDPTQGVIYSQSQLIIQLDSMAARYSWIVGRTRSHADQQEIDPTDLFFQFVGNTIANERNLYWGEATPSSSVLTSVSGTIGGMQTNTTNTSGGGLIGLGSKGGAFS